jgi:hypothetical protein
MFVVYFFSFLSLVGCTHNINIHQHKNNHQHHMASTFISPSQKRKTELLLIAKLPSHMHALPQLAHIPDATRAECIRLAITTTGTDTALIEYTVLAESINKLKGGDKKAKKVIEAKILEVLHDHNHHAKFDKQHATIRPKRRGAGHVVTNGKLFLDKDGVHFVLLSGFPVDPLVKFYIDCHHQLATELHREYKATAAFVLDRDEKQQLLTQAHRDRQGALAVLGLNAHFGIGATMDKAILKRMIPGYPSQKLAIADATGIQPEKVKGSASSHLNPIEAGGMAFMHSRIQQNLEVAMASGSMDGLDDKGKRRKLMQITNDWVQHIPLPEISFAENANRAYNPIVGMKCGVGVPTSQNGAAP